MAENVMEFGKLAHIGRTTKVVKGGRRFRFGAIYITGNQNGMVGVGTGFCGNLPGFLPCKFIFV